MAEADQTLVKQLGIAAGEVVSFLYPPQGYLDLLGDGLDEVTVMDVVDSETSELDVIQVFFTELKVLKDELSTLMAVLSEEGALWVSWPKEGSPIETDITEGDVRDFGSELNLVAENKVDIDTSWQALKFVYRH